ncbi:hypothetical protein [Ornithinimicrobium kibberense]|uniref:hypothetical protein n=1 Tax=Ornithinimicrobium kibberense TaxID=282060 RepID=UPI003608AAD5
MVSRWRSSSTSAPSCQRKAWISQASCWATGSRESIRVSRAYSSPSGPTCRSAGGPPGSGSGRSSRPPGGQRLHPPGSDQGTSLSSTSRPPGSRWSCRRRSACSSCARVDPSPRPPQT